MKNHGVLVTPRITHYCTGTITDEYTEHIRGTIIMFEKGV
jgi:hypothetical protein